MDARESAATDPVTTERKTCRGCDAAQLESVLDLGTQFLPRFVAEPDNSLPKSPLHLVRCADCGLLQLAHTVSADLLYREFWYRSGINESMRVALHDLVRDAVRRIVRGTWLDIGANDGYLLSRVPQTFRKVAVEPALNLRDELGEHADVVVSDYFSAAAINGVKCDVITSAAMFYDLDNPGAFLDDIRNSLANGGIWINQLNDSPTMMKANAFDAICHEHLCYYDLHTLRALYDTHGLRIAAVTHNDVNGGSIRVTAMRHQDLPDKEHLPMTGMPRTSAEDAQRFARRIIKWKDVFGELVSNLGPGLWCYGASTKGSTLLQYLDMNPSFEAVADRNPRKHGLRMVGSWLPIKNEEEFRVAAPRYALVLPWAFKSEFMAREKDARAAGTNFVFPLPNPEVVL